MREHEIFIHRQSSLNLTNLLAFAYQYLFTNLSNVARGKDFVNKLAKLSHDLIYKIFISLPSCNSCE